MWKLQILVQDVETPHGPIGSSPRLSRLLSPGFKKVDGAD